jgi:hypothetical protein
VRDVHELFDLADEKRARAVGLDGHSDVEEACVGRGSGFQAEKIEPTAARDAQDADERAFGLLELQMERKSVQCETSSIISELDMPGPTIGQTLAS